MCKKSWRELRILDYVGSTSGIDDAIYANTDRATAQKIISIARYLAVSDGHTLPKMKVWQLSHPVPYDGPITDDVYHELFARIGLDETLVQGFFDARCKQYLSDKDGAVAYDSTTVSTYSEQLEDARYGFNKAGDGLMTYKLLTLYGLNSRQPLTFEKRPGNIPDVTCITNMIEQLRAHGVSNAEIITDNAYYSEDNLAAMLWKKFNFVTRVKNNIKWVRSELDMCLEQLTTDLGTVCPFDPQVNGVTIRLTRPFARARKYANHRTGAAKGTQTVFTRRIYLHLFRDHRKWKEDESALREHVAEAKKLLETGMAVEDLPEHLQSIATKYMTVHKKGRKTSVMVDVEKCRDALKYHGCFALVSSRERDCFACLWKYRHREHIEDFFEIAKQQVDGTRPRVWSSDTLQGRLFVQFVALCYIEHLHELLRHMKAELGQQNAEGTKTSDQLANEKKLLSWINKNSLDDQLHWFDTTQEICVGVGIHRFRWTSETTRRDRLYLEKLGVLSVVP